MNNIFNWIKSLFKKNKNISTLSEATKKENDVNGESEKYNYIKELQMRDDIYTIKYKYEQGIIELPSLSREQLIELIRIYDTDISKEKTKIEILKEKIQKYTDGNDGACYNN